jgi:hypothetical protein
LRVACDVIVVTDDVIVVTDDVIVVFEKLMRLHFPESSDEAQNNAIKARGLFLTSPLGANFDPRGEVVQQR